jgi:hypothetical protein
MPRLRSPALNEEQQCVSSAIFGLEFPEETWGEYMPKNGSAEIKEKQSCLSDLRVALYNGQSPV